MAWLTAKCPVSVQAERWIQDSLRWLLAEFGGDALNGEVLLPESVFPPGSFSGTEAGLRPLLQRLCTRVGVDIDAIQVDLRPFRTDSTLKRRQPGQSRRTGGRQKDVIARAPAILGPFVRLR